MIFHNKPYPVLKKAEENDVDINAFLSSETPIKSTNPLRDRLKQKLKLKRESQKDQDNNIQKVDNNITDSKSSTDFFEHQSDPLSCGRHALNNLLGSQIFVKQNAKEGQVNLLELCKNLKNLKHAIKKKFSNEINLNLLEYDIPIFNDCLFEENYEINLLLYALLHIGKNAKLIGEKDSIFTNNNKLEMVLNLGGSHWVSIISSSSSISNGQHNYYDSLQEEIIKFNNRTDMYNYLKRIGLERYQGILLDKDSVDSNNLVKKTLVDMILDQYYNSWANNKENNKDVISHMREILLNFKEHNYKPFSKHSSSFSSTPSSTDFMIKHNGIIYAIGDIHGDIIPLIICLRDCCRVIKKKKSFNFTQQQIDEDLNTQMEKEWNDSSFVDHLNYEWCGENAYVVFCGDLLDNVRNYAVKKPGEFPFEEAKIFKFINAINKQAMQQGGRLFKVLGNHDMTNLNGIPYTDCISQDAQKYDGYKNGAKGRLYYFSKGNPGAKLIGEDGAYLFLMINDFIFVHGGINTDLLLINNIEKVNKSLMDYIYNKRSTINFDYSGDSTESQLTFNNRSENGLTLDRSFGYNKYHLSENAMCNELHARFLQFTQSIKRNNKYKHFFSSDQNKMKLVIGHCTQVEMAEEIMYKTMFEEEKNTYTNNNILVNIEFGGRVSSNSAKTGIYGITVSCGDKNADGKMDHNKPSIYRVDVAMSRALNKKSKSHKYNVDYSRTPQVLKIIYINEEPVVSVIKSTHANTKNHLTERAVIPKLSKWHQKYQKYKSKYIKLKDEIKNI